jgi:hypothetical protein
LIFRKSVRFCRRHRRSFLFLGRLIYRLIQAESLPKRVSLSSISGA